MEQIIAYFKQMGSLNADGSPVYRFGTTIQALGVTAGGLIGVFATLGIFFLVIWVSDKVGKKDSADSD
jgi:hypothetical protein